MILEAGSITAGVIVDAVDEVLTVEDTQIEQALAADSALIDSIATIDERLVVLLKPSTIFTGIDTAAAA